MADQIPIAEGRKRLVIWCLQRLIRLYQLIGSPWIGGQCRFYPTCSHYAYEALEIHGVRRGLWLTICRLGRCHPFNEGGVDEVPQSDPCKSANSYQGS